MCAFEHGLALLRHCGELTQRAEQLFAEQRPESLEELMALYSQRNACLEQLRHWWRTADPQQWTAHQARQWLNELEELVQRSTRQLELLRHWLEQSEQRLANAARAQHIVQYTLLEEQCHGD